MDHSGHGTGLSPFTLGRGLAWSADPFFLVACLVGLALYGWGVVRLVRRGDKWPVGRTVAYVAGVLLVMLVTCTGLNDYGMVMFSVHMVQHMVISMVAPIMLLLGAPVTLALRALPVAGRGRKGLRELLLMFLHSWYMKIVTHPAFTIPMFIASLYGLYFTPIFDFLMGSTLGHIVMMTHFLMVGLFFFWPIMGVDPGPHRPGYLMRMLELFAGMPFHAFFGIALMMASTPMVKTYENPPASLGIDALADQNAAGGIAWAFSEIPSVLVLLALLFQWYGSEQRQARRMDRAADRDGDKELEAYNAYLASLDARGR
ncbi:MULTISPECIES: cytochrome c oxidase assembly protein [Streptomyces]|uniref:Putative membrane protein/putative copper resistance protein D n=1 Tax=Streptomyces stelliscabiei TaxID=146820 RepID=A0A8I0P4V8_9ACTN|nr:MULTISPECIES: cytochrome c oxidase assembly protein [Streptomyces]KND42213.1 membrane protein [Streptomyces stelliscabiei]MBE1595368.1 putative membrane protein/putative copper resistance protein D [Streptomyces stelliscabiei]MDX2517381.1 cytochrome c oxidase assembly protein [Streptomyces stelliscabiei]MDX2554539.1 cytochrome c oxidase assembly protein [Streptomyces stelliscabiei]MDX2613067.1 cytochrome c oxidase assembly protein [Streptomyces stelliscabiei]